MKKLFIFVFAVTIIIQTFSFVCVTAENSGFSMYQSNEIEIVEKDNGTYSTLYASDKQGNSIVINSTDNFFVYNGEVVDFTISEETINYEAERAIQLDDYVKVNTTTITYAQSQAISSFSADLLAAAIGWKLGMVLSIYRLIINYYSKPGLTSQNTFYVRTDEYAYRPILSTFYHHCYGLDANYKKISGTDYFDNSGLKKFLGY